MPAGCSRSLDPAQAAALLLEVWERNLPLLHRRLDTLKHAAQVAASGALPPELREEAMTLAHKLAGSLGMFGYPEGTRLARCIEQLLEDSPCPDAATFAGLTSELRVAVGL